MCAYGVDGVAHVRVSRLLRPRGQCPPTTSKALAPFSLARTEKTVRRFTLAAMATGAIPVPAASAAIVAENAAMISVIASQLGVPVVVELVAKSLGVAGTLNMFGRAVFVEAARAIGWAAGPAGLAGVSALGAAMAGIQTWVVGQLAVEIAKNHGRSLTPAKVRRTLREAKSNFKDWRSQAN